MFILPILKLALFCINRVGYLMLDTRFSILSRCGGIGFVLALFFSTGVKANIGVSLWGKRDCGDSGVLGIGFVLHN